MGWVGMKRSGGTFRANTWNLVVSLPGTEDSPEAAEVVLHLFPVSILHDPG